MNTQVAERPTSGLSAEHKAALDQAFLMMTHGSSDEEAVQHLAANGMPKMIAKVLVKQKRNCV